MLRHGSTTVHPMFHRAAYGRRYRPHLLYPTCTQHFAYLTSPGCEWSLTHPRFSPPRHSLQLPTSQSRVQIFGTSIFSDFARFEFLYFRGIALFSWVCSWLRSAEISTSACSKPCNE